MVTSNLQNDLLYTSRAVLAVLSSALKYYRRFGWFWYGLPTVGLVFFSIVEVKLPNINNSYVVAVFLSQVLVAVFGFSARRLYESYFVRTAPVYQKSVFGAMAIIIVTLSVLGGVIVSRSADEINTLASISILIVLNAFILKSFWGNYRIAYIIIGYFVLMYVYASFIRPSLADNQPLVSILNTVALFVTSTYMVSVFSMSMDFSCLMISRNNGDNEAASNLRSENTRIASSAYEFYCLAVYGRRRPNYLGVNISAKQWRGLRFGTLDSDEMSLMFYSCCVFLFMPFLALYLQRAHKLTTFIVFVLVLALVWTGIAMVSMIAQFNLMNYRRLYLQSPSNSLPDFLAEMIKLIWYRLSWIMALVAAYLIYLDLLLGEKYYYVFPILLIFVCVSVIYLVWVVSSQGSSFARRFKENFRSYSTSAVLLPFLMCLGIMWLLTKTGVGALAYSFFSMCAIVSLYCMHRALVSWKTTEVEY